VLLRWGDGGVLDHSQQDVGQQLTNPRSPPTFGCAFSRFFKTASSGSFNTIIRSTQRSSLSILLVPFPDEPSNLEWCYYNAAGRARACRGREYELFIKTSDSGYRLASSSSSPRMPLCLLSPQAPAESHAIRSLLACRLPACPRTTPNAGIAPLPTVCQ
jgi:hypothetical protein